MNTSLRYADSDLEKFKTIVEQKLERAKSELNYYQGEIIDASDKINEETDDWTEGAMALGDLELLSDLIRRQRIYIKELEMALQRVHDKTYGICEVTGKLINKNRLMALPILRSSQQTNVDPAPAPDSLEDDELDIEADFKL